MQFTKVHQKLAKPVYEAIPKIAEKAGKKWEWEPRWGEMVIYKKMIALITGVNPLKEDNQYDMLLQVSSSGVTPEIRARTEDVIPLLHWEDDIEPILEGIHGEIHFQKLIYYFCRIVVRNSKFIQADGRYLEVTAKSKDRQTSAMLAVIQLRKKMEK